MVEKMSFISISGPMDDLERVVNQTLSSYEIQYENALTTLKSTVGMAPCPGNNPYKETYLKAQKLAADYLEQPGPHKQSSPISIGEAVRLTEQIGSFFKEYEDSMEKLVSEAGTVHGLLDQVELFKELDFNIPVILNFRHIKYRFGRVSRELFPQLEALANSSENVILCKCHESGDYVSLLYFIPAEYSERVDAAFSSLQFERIFLPDQYQGTPQEEIEALQTRSKELWNAMKELDAKKERYLAEYGEKLLSALAVLELYQTRFNVRRFAAVTTHGEHPFYILCGWITEADGLQLKKELSRDENTFFALEDSREFSLGGPPTKLKNPPLFRPFEMFVRMYGLPAYGEFDPTMIIAVTYSIFFGFMFGDVGQGLLLFAGGLILYKAKHMDLAAIISCCGIFSTIFGFLFGSIFGFEDVIPALWLKPTIAMTELPFVGRLNTVFVVAVGLGMVMILFAMVLNMIVSFRAKDPEKTWFDANGAAGLVFYGSLVTVILLFMKGKPLPAVAVMAVMFLIPLLLIFLKEPLAGLVERRSGKITGGLGMFFMQGFFELFEVLLSYFSNTLSFVRVGAFAVSHAAMMEVVLMLAGAETGDISLPVMVLGNLIVCGMEGLVVGIQVLRLEYYELFSRFYKGDGKEFRPFQKHE